MRKTLIVLLVAIVFAGKAMGLTLTTPDGIEIEYECMVETPGAATIPNPEIRIVFIRFPQANAGGYLGYPNWATPSPTVPSWLENEIGSYLNAMSVGAQQPQVEIWASPRLTRTEISWQHSCQPEVRHATSASAVHPRIQA